MGIGGDIGGGLGSAIGGGIGLATAGSGGEKFLKRALEIMEEVKTSRFDYRSLSPPDLRILAEFSPETYNAVVPPEVRQASDSQAGRGALLGGIGYMEGVRDRGLPVETRLAVDEATRGVADQFQRGQDTALAGMQARGRLGGGSEISARIGGDQQAMELARGMGTDVARSEIERRMHAANAAAGLGATERAGTIGLGQFNADTTNRFNQWLANAQNEQNQYNAGARERAQFQNVGNRQRLGEENEMAAYNTALQNLTRQNALRGTQFDQELQKAQGMTGALGALGAARYDERAARIANAQALGKGVGQTGGGLLDIFGGGF